MTKIVNIKTWFLVFVHFIYYKDDDNSAGRRGVHDNEYFDKKNFARL